MSPTGPQAVWLDGGARLHLQHGPIDLIIGAEGPARDAACAAAVARFETILEELVAELAILRAPLRAGGLRGSVARRMERAGIALARAHFLTPMIAVAGAVADEVLSAMRAAGPLSRAYVNNGGDIAVHLAPGARFSVAMATGNGADLGRVVLDAPCGIATSGAGGRSLSLGIADSVTVLAADAARADAAATLIANAVDLPDHPLVRRVAARELDPDSDLGGRRVVTHVPTLAPTDRQKALASGHATAEDMVRAGLITGAALFLQGAVTVVGDLRGDRDLIGEVQHA